MTINIQNYVFEGPTQTTALLQSRSGVYVVLTKAHNGKYNLLDVGESVNVRYRVETHDRTDCWYRNKVSGIYYAAYYVSGEMSRQSIEKEIRSHFTPVCGKF